jgi:APA family basic amino acid/polyamine antiporter
MNSDQNEGLKREIGVADVATNAVNNIIGGGIFLLPALVAASIGNAAILAYLVCGIMLFAVMLCFAEASSRVTGTGGAYAYIENSFGQYAGFIANSFYWFGCGILSDAALTNGMLDILSFQFHFFSIPVYRGIFFFLFFGGFALINIRGVKQGMRAIRIGTIFKLVPLALLIVAGSFKIQWHNLQWQQWPSAHNLGEASIILFFAFMGGDVAVIVGGEMKNPKRTGAVGIIWGICLVAIFYILIQLVAQGVMGTDLKNHKDGPLTALAQIVMGHWGAILITIGATISIFANVSSSPLLYPRIIFAAAEDKLLPAFLAKLHSRFATPYYAIIIYALFDIVFSVSGGFKQLAILSGTCMLLLYMGVALSVIQLRAKKDAAPTDTFKIPGGITIPVIAVIIVGWFLSHLMKNELIGIAIFAMVLTVIYLFRSFMKKKNHTDLLAPN